MGTARKVGRGVGAVMKWLLVLGALIIVLVIIAFFFALGAEADQSEQSSKAITPAKYAAIKVGQTQARVLKTIGENPQNVNETDLEGYSVQCWHYGVGAPSGTYQFCFVGGKLTSKSKT